MARGMVRKDSENTTCEMFLGYREMLSSTVGFAPTAKRHQVLLISGLFWGQSKICA
jgi:hypothetical protein